MYVIASWLNVSRRSRVGLRTEHILFTFIDRTVNYGVRVCMLHCRLHEANLSPTRARKQWETQTTMKCKQLDPGRVHSENLFDRKNCSLCRVELNMDRSAHSGQQLTYVPVYMSLEKSHSFTDQAPHVWFSTDVYGIHRVQMCK